MDRQRAAVQGHAAHVEQHAELPVPEPGGRVPRAAVRGPVHRAHVRHAVADGVVPVGAGHAVPDRAGGQPRDQAGPVLGDGRGPRARRRRPQRPVPQHQHVRVPGRDGPGAAARVRDGAVRRAVLHAVVRAHGQAVRPVAGHGAAARPGPRQDGDARAAARRPAGAAHGPLLQGRGPGGQVGRGARRQGPPARRPVRRAVPGRVPRQDQRGTGLFRQQRPGGGGREY